jgi:hypothetical protein
MSLLTDGGFSSIENGGNAGKMGYKIARACSQQITRNGGLIFLKLKYTETPSDRRCDHLPS